jgi:hypothetical protein
MTVNERDAFFEYLLDNIIERYNTVEHWDPDIIEAFVTEHGLRTER